MTIKKLTLSQQYKLHVYNKKFWFLNRWGKCKLNLLGLTSGNQRPGQAGTTGQLFFSKCGDPPKGCECKFEAPKGNSNNLFIFANLAMCQSNDIVVLNIYSFERYVF